jgi:hypothetical protein
MLKSKTIKLGKTALTRFDLETTFFTLIVFRVLKRAFDHLKIHTVHATENESCVYNFFSGD